MGREGGRGRQQSMGTWGRRLWGEKALASLLPACSLLHCTAAVSAGMAPLTICSLIANIRVHFLRHWTGTERWRAVLWAFLSLSLCLSRSISTLPGAGVRTHKCTYTHRNLTGGRWVIQLIYTIWLCPAVHPSQNTHKFNSTIKWRTWVLGAF